MHRRFITKLHVTATLVVISFVVYTAWVHPSLRIRTRLTKAWSGPSRKIVVFGDSFSDTGSLASLASKTKPVQSAEPDAVRWAEVLCTELKCDTLINFARTAANTTRDDGGVVVDNNIYTNATSRNGDESSVLLPDLKDQMDEWLAYETQLGSAESDEEFIFALTIGTWDIWRYATLDLRAAQDAISNSISVLFTQLDILAESFDEPIQIVLPRLWDLSFTPRFRSLAEDRSSQPNRFSEVQHKLIYLIQYWNTVLVQYAANWEHGQLYLPDWNSWLSDQIRAVQMDRLGIPDALQLQTEAPAFKDVANPCASSFVPADLSLSDGAAADTHVSCQSPRQHLFWDDTQFSGAAHEILGALAAEMLRTNETANAKATTHPSNTNKKSDKVAIGKPRLVPSLAPGN